MSNPRSSTLAIAILFVCAFASRSVGAERVEWQHPALELFFTGASDSGERARIDLCFETQAGFSEATTRVESPRYRRAWGPWVDCVLVGVDRHRVLRASAVSGPACFSVIVARDATALELEIEGRRAQFDTEAWLAVPLQAAPRPKAAPSPKATPAPELTLSPNAPAPEPSVPVEDPWGSLEQELEEELEDEPSAPASAPLGPQVVLLDERTVEGAAPPLAREQIVGVRLRAKNVGQETAHSVMAWIEPASGVVPAQDAASRIDLGELAPGAEREFVYRCYADRSAASLSFQVTLDHAGGRGAASVVNVPLAGATPTPPVSDVDRSVPRSREPRPSALAVVFGVETLTHGPPATFAAADAKAASRYFQDALGIPAERVELLLDGEATLGQLQRVFGKDGWLARRSTPDSEIFVYFAGHGMAELEKFTPYLLPADADPDYLRQTAFPLDAMMELLAALGARRTTLFLDVCFTGLSREGESLLTDARPLVLEQASRAPAGISVYSAGSRGQIASALAEQGHGLFSYYLFKGLGGEADLDRDRRVVAAELKSYLEDQVPRAAQALDREQFPSIVLEDPELVLVQLP
jgi:Caspase domain